VGQVVLYIPIEAPKILDENMKHTERLESGLYMNCMQSPKICETSLRFENIRTSHLDSTGLHRHRTMNCHAQNDLMFCLRKKLTTLGGTIVILHACLSYDCKEYIQ
jgi:hypothetical protein